MADKLSYEDLKLGEKAKKAFLDGKTPEYIKENCPVYLNTNNFFAGLNVTDLAVAGVLAGMNTLLIGNTGCGKSQLARDIHNYYFNGSKLEGGHALTIEGHSELDIYRDILTDINKEQVQRVLNGNHKSLFWDLEEFNRCPPIAQNQFLAIGNGRIMHKGNSIPIGDKGYVSSIATANYGNGEFKGTFDVDKALGNRFGLVLDLDYSQFQPTIEDRILIDRLREAHPGIKEAPKRDLTEKIIQANKEISQLTLEPGLEARAVMDYLKFGLGNCQGEGESPTAKGKTWPYKCQDCSRNKNGKEICSLVSVPVQRTLQSVARYASALHYLAKLKNPEQEINPVDLMFKAFELTSAYQNVLNPSILKSEYLDEAPKMIAEVAERLKSDFKENQDIILTSLEEATKGNRALDYFKTADGTTLLGYSELSQKGKSAVNPYEPFNNNRAIGLSWVKDAVDIEIDMAKNKKDKDSQEKQENKEKDKQQ
ncbi:MAG: AAA family ATPase [Candidatus Pacearchaeota archaeon]